MSAKSILAAARRDLGLSGRPNRITRAYASRNGPEFLRAPWCDMSITEWARASGNAAAALPAGDRAFTVWHAQDGDRLGRWHPGTAAAIKAHARPGAIVFFDWRFSDRISAIDHVGIVEVNIGDGRIQTIEGNSGDACKRRVRGPDVIAGFWNPAYQEQEGNDDMPTAREIADAVYERFSHTLTSDLWAVKAGILEDGQKVDPRGTARQTWAYGKDSYHRLREIIGLLQQLLALVDEQSATIRGQSVAIRELGAVVGRQDGAVDVEALVGRIEAALGQIRVRLDVGQDGNDGGGAGGA